MTDRPLRLSQDFLDLLPGIHRIGVAVSGGSDSLGLLHLVCDAIAGPQPAIFVASVNHGLRAEAADECAQVARICAAAGLSHETLLWQGWDGSGNLQNAAREARYRLLADWAKRHGVTHILLGHTADDQAETVLMRLARGAGVDGLAAIPARITRHGVHFLRPLLDVQRANIRAYLKSLGVAWADDPSNDDDDFDRIKARKALAALAGVGVGVQALGQVARNMADASVALDHETRHLLAAHVRSDRGDLLVPVEIWKDLPKESARRLAIAMLRHINGAVYPPRRSEQMHLLADLRGGQSATLAGCRISAAKRHFRFVREYQALRDLTCESRQIWDNRWQLDGPHAPGLHIGALGDAVKECGTWRDTGMPRASLCASPAVWRGKTLISAPVAGLENGWTARIVADFTSFLISH